MPQEEFPVKGIYFLSKLDILFDICLSKITLFRAKYLSKTTIFPRSEKVYPTLVITVPILQPDPARPHPEKCKISFVWFDLLYDFLTPLCSWRCCFISNKIQFVLHLRNRVYQQCSFMCCFVFLLIFYAFDQKIWYFCKNMK